LFLSLSGETAKSDTNSGKPQKIAHSGANIRNLFNRGAKSSMKQRDHHRRLSAALSQNRAQVTAAQNEAKVPVAWCSLLVARSIKNGARISAFC
jgi:hypothetical protein